MRRGLLAGDYVNEKIEHVRLGQGSGNVRSLQSAPLVILGMDPCPHGQLRDEDVTALGKQDGRFRGYHLHLGVCFHHLLYAGQGQLVDLVVVVI